MFQLLFILCSLLHFNVCHAAFTLPDNIPRCSLENNTCQGVFLGTLRNTFGRTGIPSIGVPVPDPFQLTNSVIYVLGLEVTLVKGEAVGITTCTLISYRTNLDTFYREIEIICPKITIKGKYTASVVVPFVKLVTCDVIKAKGKITMDMEDWYFKLKFPIEFVRHADDEIYLREMYEHGEYVAEVRGDAEMKATGFKLGPIDISDQVNAFFNCNWQYINTCFADSFNDQSVQYFYDTYAPFYENVPATSYLTDDLTKYVRDQC